MPEAGAQCACLASPIKTLPEVFPPFAINAPQIGTAWRVPPCGNGGDQARLAPQHRRRRGGFAPGSAALVAALRAELMLEVVVGARQIRHGIAVKQPRTITAGDLAELVDGLAQAARTIAVAGHGTHQAVEAALNRSRILVLMVVQDVRGLMDPFVGPFDVRPERGGLFQAMLDQAPATARAAAGPPFSVTRATLSATASNRPLSFRPEAASGGWPSSVMALRTAAQ